ncbi:MAG: DNA repair protein RecO [Desulfurivibrio sp.]|nr:DNA repair protein RecO [Desulfurivibrio sp.]
MPLQQTSAVVLGVSSYGEADKIVTFYGRTTGKFSGIAKGANRSRIRFVNKLELFSLLELTYEPGRRSSLVRIDQAELSHPFAAIRRDYARYTTAALAGELVSRFSGEDDHDARIFSLLLWVLHAIADCRQPMVELPPLAIFFETKLLALLGYCPDLQGCRRCGTLAATARPFHFSLGQSGLLCASCNRADHGLIPLSLGTVRLLARVLELAPDKLSRLRLPAANAREAAHLLKHYSRHLLQREINSRACFLELLNGHQ